jgi:NADPH:quinone reductase-like Zn-dependent oxidoreductase
MRKAAYVTHTGPESVELIEAPVPTPGAGQVRVRVAAAAVHPADVASVAGLWPDKIALAEPRALGWDLAGTIDAVGPDVTDYRPGDAVLGFSFWLGGFNGTQAEYVVLDLESVALAPQGVSLLEAATLPLNGLTAWQALDLLGLPAGATVVITGAAGGVGGFAVQLAAARGLRVIGIASPSDEEVVKAFGAAEFVSRDQPLPQGADGLFDAAPAGPETIKAVRDGGAFVSAVAVLVPEPERGVTTTDIMVSANQKQLTELSTLVSSGKVKLRLAQSFAFADAVAAYQYVAKGGIRGGVVLNLS